MPGPKPKPTRLKVLQGNPGHQKLPKNEPKPRPIRPDSPAFLSETARSIWDSLVDELDTMGVLTLVDASVFAGYCSAYAEAQECDKHLAENGLTMTAPSGYSQARPEVAIRNKAWDRVAKFGAELGIGAASRSRIEVKKPDGSDKDTAKEILGVTAGGRKS